MITKSLKHAAASRSSTATVFFNATGSNKPYPDEFYHRMLNALMMTAIKVLDNFIANEVSTSSLGLGGHGVLRIGKQGVAIMGGHGVQRMGEHGIPRMGE